jgi:hypothetical protein
LRTRDGARIDQGVCITSHASQCRTVDQVVVLPDGADAKGWYVSLSRAREAMHVYTRDKAALRQSVMQPGERKSVWEFIQALRKSTLQSRDRIMPFLWATQPTGNSSRDGNGRLIKAFVVKRRQDHLTRRIRSALPEDHCRPAIGRFCESLQTSNTSHELAADGLCK